MKKEEFLEQILKVEFSVITKVLEKERYFDPDPSEYELRRIINGLYPSLGQSEDINELIKHVLSPEGDINTIKKILEQNEISFAEYLDLTVKYSIAECIPEASYDEILQKLREEKSKQDLAAFSFAKPANRIKQR